MTDDKRGPRNLRMDLDLAEPAKGLPAYWRDVPLFGCEECHMRFESTLLRGGRLRVTEHHSDNCPHR